jgi:hypothetical protein
VELEGKGVAIFASIFFSREKNMETNMEGVGLESIGLKIPVPPWIIVELHPELVLRFGIGRIFSVIC